MGRGARGSLVSAGKSVVGPIPPGVWLFLASSPYIKQCSGYCLREGDVGGLEKLTSFQNTLNHFTLDIILVSSQSFERFLSLPFISPLASRGTESVGTAACLRLGYLS